MKFNYIFTLIFAFIFQNTFCQGKPIDSLVNLSYNELNVNFRVTGFDSITAFKHATAYQDLAVFENL